MTISHICGNWPLYFTLKNKSGPVGIEKSIFMKSVFYKSCFFWSKLQKKHCPKLQFQKIKFMKRPNVHVHRVQCPPRQRPRVGEVAWLRGEEKDEAEEEEEGMGEVSWLRGGRKRWHRRRTNFWHGRTKTTTTGTEGILRGPKKYFEQRHCLNKGIVPM